MPGLCSHHVSSTDIGSGFLQYGRIGQQETLLNDYHLGSSGLLQVPEFRECTLVVLEKSKAQGAFWSLETKGFCFRSPSMAKFLW